MKINEVIKSLPASNAAIKNTASSEPKEGWYPAYSASGQDVWLPDCRFTQKGIVVSAVGARCGKAFKADGKWNVCANTHPLSVDETKALRDYCWYMINNEDWWIKGGTAQPFVKVKDSFNRDFNFPPISEQKLIVHRLDTIQSLINQKQLQIKRLDELVKARFVEMFGMPGTDPFSYGIKELGKCCELNPKKAQDKRLASNIDVSFVPMPSVSENGKIDPTDIRPYEAVKKGFTYFAEDDVLFAKITPCMENGKGAIAKGLKNGIGFGSTEFHVLRPINGTSNPYWIYTLTSFKSFRKDAEANMTGSAGQRRTPVSFLDEYKVALPPIHLQEQFATFVTQVDKSKFTLSNEFAMGNFYVRLIHDRIMHGRIDL